MTRARAFDFFVRIMLAGTIIFVSDNSGDVLDMYSTISGRWTGCYSSPSFLCRRPWLVRENLQSHSPVGFKRRGRVSSRNFILGFALIQALPGPQFNFAIYLGVLALPTEPVVGAILGCIAIFTPGIVLKIGLLPLYSKWRSNSIAKSVLRGLNATAVGLVSV